MLDDLPVDDSEHPAIGLVPAGVPWQEAREHARIARAPILFEPAEGGEYRGLYWSDEARAILVADDLGDDQDEALEEFRDLLRERGIA